MFSCGKVLCVTTTIKNITKKFLNNVTDFVAFFSIQTVEGSGYYGIDTPLPYMRNLTTRLYFSSLNNNSVV